MYKLIATRARALALTGALVTAVAGSVAVAGAADAATPSSLSCSDGYNNANTAWFTCSGSGSWEGWVNCYYAPGHNTGWIDQSSGTVHEWLTCGSPSHVTGLGIHYG